MTKWEYATFASRGEEIYLKGPHFNTGIVSNNMKCMELLTTLGKEGWELVGVSYDGADITTRFFFKRPIG